MYVRMKKTVPLDQEPIRGANGTVVKDRKPLELPAGEIASVSESVGARLIASGEAEAMPADFDPRKAKPEPAAAPVNKKK